jgi:lipopolysaccharide transport system ATP-binding protein
MNDLVIRVAELGKQYALGRRPAYRTLGERLGALLTPWRWTPASATDRRFWALRDVSFSVRRGEVVGIIGRNGAGKSTLLKILSRITEPTAGEVDLCGRVGSLLEVGTGFHSELTGRENIFLNGAILGMQRAEIQRKFDEIVAFAEVEQFIDTPVKHYSSGMYMRLAFAVAAHLEPEILVVDEVLAVGDAAFQNKCLGKMEGIARQGRTVLFVSHQMATVQQLCSRVIMLDRGSVVEDGDTRRVVHKYLLAASRQARVCLEDRMDRRGNGRMRFSTVELLPESGVQTGSLRCGAPATLVLGVVNQSGRPLTNVLVSIGVDDHAGTRILLLDSEMTDTNLARLPPGTSSIHVVIDRLALAPGRYGYTLYAAAGGDVLDWVQNAGFIEVAAGDFYGTGRMPPENQGYLLLDHRFEGGDGIAAIAAVEEVGARQGDEHDQGA